MAQLVIKKDKYVMYLMEELDKANNQIEAIRKHSDKWRCQQDQEFDSDILNYRIQQLEKQINKLKK